MSLKPQAAHSSFRNGLVILLSLLSWSALAHERETESQEKKSDRSPSSVGPADVISVEGENEEKEEKRYKWNFTLNFGAVAVDNALKTPLTGLGISYSVVDRLSVVVQGEGYSASYDDGVNPAFSALQGQVKAQAQYRIFNFLWAGLGYRYFTFGYASPPQTTANSHDIVMSVIGRIELTKRIEWEFFADARESMAINSTTGGSTNLSPQFSGIDFETAIHFPVFGNFYAGPFLSIDRTSLNLPQANGGGGQGIYKSLEYTGGLDFGIRL